MNAVKSQCGCGVSPPGRNLDLVNDVEASTIHRGASCCCSTREVSFPCQAKSLRTEVHASRHGCDALGMSTLAAMTLGKHCTSMGILSLPDDLLLKSILRCFAVQLPPCCCAEVSTASLLTNLISPDKHYHASHAQWTVPHRLGGTVCPGTAQALLVQALCPDPCIVCLTCCLCCSAGD